MEKVTVNKKERFVTLLLAALFIVSAIFSTAFIIKEANHQCNHTDCQICHTMQNCIKTLTELGSDSDSTGFSAAVLYVAIITIFALLCKREHRTLVDLKAKLSN